MHCAQWACRFRTSSDEQSLAIAGYSITLAGYSMEFRGVRWAFAFFGMQVATGTLMKLRHLELLGHTLVSLPFWGWDRLTGSDERREYLRAKLHISCDIK